MTRTHEPVWDRYKIREEISRRQMTMSGLARKNGLSPSTCSLSLVRPSPAGDRVIADFLGVAINKLWPDRYDALGRRIVERKRKPPITAIAAE